MQVKDVVTPNPVVIVSASHGRAGSRAHHLLKHGRVVDVMSAPAFVTGADVDLVDAVGVMRERHVGALPVVDGRQLIGILTETDLLRRILDADAEADVAVSEIVVSYP